MGNVNFYLKAPNDSGKAAIYLQFEYATVRLKYYFGQSIAPGNWNRTKQRVKNNRQTTDDGQFLLNDLLDNLEKVLLTTYRAEMANGIPSKLTLKAALDAFINQNKEDPGKPGFYQLLDRFISGEIKHKKSKADKSPNTLKSYRTLEGHLKAFERMTKWPVNFDSINLDFLDRYIAFLRTQYTEQQIAGIQDEAIRQTLLAKPLQQNSIGKDITILKTVMKKAVSLKQTNNREFEHEDFSVAEIETDAVYLSGREIMKLYDFDLSHKPALERVRDLFVFGCYVGLRYSDYSSIKPEHIVELESEDQPISEFSFPSETGKEYFIKRITQKTGELVIIPCSPLVLQIFEKYKDQPNKLPRAVTGQKFNEYIKEACRLAGFKEKGRLSTNPDLELWQCISSHTARRSFATNLYLEGFEVYSIMKLTGHRTEKSFLRYLKISKEGAARRLNKHLKEMWNRKLLTLQIAS